MAESEDGKVFKFTPPEGSPAAQVTAHLQNTFSRFDETLEATEAIYESRLENFKAMLRTFEEKNVMKSDAGFKMIADALDELAKTQTEEEKKRRAQEFADALRIFLGRQRTIRKVGPYPPPPPTEEE